MKTILTFCFIAWSDFASAQNFAITSHKISDGGGTSRSGRGSTGGNYTLTGTIAQHEAGSDSAGGAYRLSGGFLAQYMALQQSGAPQLTIRSSGALVKIVWGSNVQGWKLQANSSSLAPAGWFDVAGTPAVSGAEQFLQFSAGGGSVFFRLRKL